MINIVGRLAIIAVIGGVIAGCTAEQSREQPRDQSQKPPDLADVREHVLNATNTYREKRGVSPLKTNDILRKAAQDYAEYLIARPGQFGSWGHYTDGSDPVERIRLAGYSGCGGENLYFGWTTSGLPALGPTAMEGWIDSSGHEANLRRVSFAEIGIGVATRKWRGRWFFVVVQNFGDGTNADRCVSSGWFCFFC